MFDVGLIQLREWLRSGRVKDGADDYVPSSGDLLAVGYLDGRRVHGDSQVFVRSTEFDADHAIIFESLGYEIWRVVDDSEGLYGYHRCEDCGRWVFEFDLDVDIDDGVPGEWFSYRWYCHDWKGCEEFSIRKEQLNTLEALRQLRDAGEFPIPAIVPEQPTCIRYDVYRYDHVLGKFACCGRNLRYADARELVRRAERCGTVSYLAESEGVGYHG